MNFRVSIDQLNKLFLLDEEGRLFWRQSPRGSVPAGSQAGTLNPRGYLMVSINGKKTGAHRIVFAMTHGYWPDPEADHINGIKDDNRPSNLREATRSQNQWNRTKYKNNISGFKGVSWQAARGKWKVQIKTNGITEYLGLFADPVEAAGVYEKAAESRHGVFANAR